MLIFDGFGDFGDELGMLLAQQAGMPGLAGQFLVEHAADGEAEAARSLLDLLEQSSAHLGAALAEQPPVELG